MGPGVEVGPGVGVGPGGVTVGGGTVPPQAAPFRVKDVGAGLLPLCVPWKPKLTVPPLAPIVPFQWPALLAAEAVEPLCEKFAFQPLVICCPALNVQESVYPCTAVLLLLVTTISAVKPVFQLLAV